MSTSPVTAGDIYAAAEKDIDLPSWPDVATGWTSSSVSESHPGKRYHNAWCHRMLDVKRPQQYVKRVSHVYHQICWECFSTHGEDDLAASVARMELICWLADMRDLTEAVDAGTFDKGKHLTGTLRSTAGGGRRIPRDLAARLGGYVQDVLNLAAARQSAQVDPHVAEACAFALLPDSAFPKGTVSNPGGGSPKLGKTASTRLGPERHHLEVAWKAFLEQVKQGATIPAAGQAARRALAQSQSQRVTSSMPLLLEQLDGFAVTPQHASQPVTVADFVPQWKAAVAAISEETIAGWERDVAANLELSDQVGTLRVHAPNTGYNNAPSRYAGRYPVNQFTGEMHLPGAIAYLVVRQEGTVLDDGDQAELARTAQHLLETGLPWLAAWATARTLTTQEPSAA